MKSLAIIPARSGSKRIPNKNKRLFLGRPLISWTIEAALKARPLITDIVVTTDDNDILKLATEYPLVKFYERPANLAQDLTTSLDVILDVMNHYNTYDQIILLQPTSPLRSDADIKNAIELCEKKGAAQLVSVRRCHEVPGHIVKEGPKGGLSLLLEAGSPQNRGQLWVLNGAMYVSNWDIFLDRKTFLTEYTIPFEMPENVSIDIDIEEDWLKAEKVAKEMQWK
ncbi:MAG TPA: acylneuraminate cytidylyltransferase family protein [Bdellovibrio sp.]|nr:acylneuraminate cytidylyltransferase family protein [Bdellovibrio sp.]